MPLENFATCPIVVSVRSILVKRLLDVLGDYSGTAAGKYWHPLHSEHNYRQTWGIIDLIQIPSTCEYQVHQEMNERSDTVRTITRPVPFVDCPPIT